MPTSSNEGKDFIYTCLTNNLSNAITSVLDLGAGRGTYYNLFKENNNILAHAHWTGVEVWKPYVDKYNLHKKYDILINQDIRQIDFKLLGKFDISFAGDVLEHMTKEECVSVVESILSVSKHLIISIPIVHYPQGHVNDNPYEEHIKNDWSHEEMTETFPKIKDYFVGDLIGVYIL